MELQKLYVSLLLDADKFSQGLQEAGRKAQGFASDMTGRVGGALQNVGRIATGAFLGLGAAAVGGFGLAMKSAIDMNASLEQSTMQFTTLMGDADQAASHVAMLFEMGAKTPFETEPIIAASKHLQIFGGAALNTQENLLMIGDASAAVGQNFDEVAFWTGRLYSNLQAGQPFGEAAARLSEMGIMAPEVRTQLEAMREEGATGSEMWGVYSDELGKFTGAMEMQAGSWEGMMSTLKDQLSMAAATGLKPFFDIARAGLGWLVNSGVIERAGNIFSNFFKLIITAPDEGGPLLDYLQELPTWLQPIGTFLAEAAVAIKAFTLNLQEGMSPIDAFIEAIWDMAPQPVLDFLINFRDNILPGLTTAFHSIVDPIVTWVQNNVQLKDVLTALGIAILSVVIPAVVSLVISMAPIFLTIGALIAVVALLRNAWESNFLGIRDKLQEAWAAIQPVLQIIWDWLQVAIPAALETLRAFWVDKVWPAIQNIIQAVWPVIMAIFQAIIDFFVNAIIPTVKELYTVWVEDVWPAISKALQWAWDNVLKPILDAIWKFITETLVPALQELDTVWTEVVWPAIKTAVKEAWDFIQPIWENIKTFASVTIPNAIVTMRDKFNEIMGNIRSAIQPVKDIWDGLVGAVMGFWDWIKSHVFNFEINLPDLPDWATPGSPLPIHTAWMDFAKDMKQMDWGKALSPALNGAIAGSGGGNGAIDNSKRAVNYGGQHFHIYGRMNEESPIETIWRGAL